ncbi:Cytochrome c oxidase subunit CcoP [Thioalkalivibrio nitratireducens DSM 14787]|uniref:Cbb3-type cytochrome c oxidase subunit n=1 Tax=Thioalkalivibrio nitratireducens (strain DSM 14787 / UNIQEM 213 / ALEN2) TaxID=1255043 RepID=L0DZL9_THIND|nr:cytochrome-c oxidase, cbb3-type subunit III [Thioalkalivibrio nitratireducens]AGA33836.1 Cytochrome c oxidase subunit CcoP [Thioalkalivibrio nitratireducens DSM 14787]
MNEHDMTTFWHWWVVGLTVANILGMVWLILWTSKKRPGEVAQGEEMGHTWDGLSEYNNPLPRWWLWMFWITIVFSVIYLILYPGLGRFAGLLGWHSGNMLNVEDSQYHREMQRAEERYQPIFAAMAERGIPALARDFDSLTTGRRLYLNYCAICHGADARGARGFPDLANGVWQWGGSPDEIKKTILHGIHYDGDPNTRRGEMPAHGAFMDSEAIEQTAHYVLQLSGRPDADASLASAGEAHYNTYCMACHGADGTGMTALGAPDLTQDTWTFGGSLEDIKTSIAAGRKGEMPGFLDLLGEDRVHVLSAYVYSLDRN